MLLDCTSISFSSNKPYLSKTSWKENCAALFQIFQYLPPSMKAQCKLPEWNKKTPSDQSPAVYPIHQLMESPVIMHVTPQIYIVWNEHYQGFHHWFQPHPVILEHYHCHIQFLALSFRQSLQSSNSHREAWLREIVLATRGCDHLIFIILVVGSSQHQRSD